MIAGSNPAAPVHEPFIRSLIVDRGASADPAAHPFSIPAIASLSELDLDPHVTFLTGANASGKSTLIEAIAVACGLNPEGGSRNFSFETRASHSTLGDVMRLVRGARQPRTDFFLRAEAFFNLASEIEALDSEPAFGPPIIASYGGRSLHEQSHGQSFLALLVERFGPDGLYLLDEPESALSPQGQLAMLRRLYELVAEGCQLVIATHSPILLSFPQARIYELSESGIATVPYDSAETVALYRSFLAAPDVYLHHLSQDDDGGVIGGMRGRLPARSHGRRADGCHLHDHHGRRAGHPDALAAAESPARAVRAADAGLGRPRCARGRRRRRDRRRGAPDG